MGNMQYVIFFKQRPQALPSTIYFPFMTKIILCVQLATTSSSKISQNMGFFDKNPSGDQDSSFLKGGAIDRGGHDSSFRLGELALGGHWPGGGGGDRTLNCISKNVQGLKLLSALSDGKGGESQLSEHSAKSGEEGWKDQMDTVHTRIVPWL